MTDSPQRSLPGPSFTRRANQISKRASKQRRKVRLPVLQPNLPVADKTFEARAGVPKTRAECPKSGICEFVRCRHHLMLETAEHRAGRPGLSSVPRDARGLTMSVEGDAGDERPGTTLRPAWLQVRGLEIEREVKVYPVTGDDGTGVLLAEVRNGTLDYWLARLRVGEPVLVFDDDNGEMVAKARMRGHGELVLDRELPARLMDSTTALVLTRVREVSSCALDLIDRHGKLTNEQAGNALGRHRTLIARETKRALRKAIEVADEMGMSSDELMRGLMSMGADR